MGHLGPLVLSALVNISCQLIINLRDMFPRNFTHALKSYISTVRWTTFALLIHELFSLSEFCFAVTP